MVDAFTHPVQDVACQESCLSWGAFHERVPDRLACGERPFGGGDGPHESVQAQIGFPTRRH